ncbi:VWD domain-containing protein [Haloplanus salinus]|nr:VWD domain-containing protein [Haloplanus salinus]
MFSASPTFEEYTVEVVNANTGTVLDATEPTIHGIGYEGQLAQNSTTGYIDVTINRALGADESWYVTYEVRNETGTVLTKEASQYNGQYHIPIDSNKLKNGTYAHSIEIFKNQADPVGDRFLGIFTGDSGPNSLTINHSSSPPSADPDQPDASPTNYTAQNGLAIHDGFAYVNTGGEIQKIVLENSTTINSFPAPSGAQSALAYGDGSLWFADGVGSNFDGEIVELNPETGEVRSRIDTSYDVPALAYGDGSLWATDITSNRIVEFTPAGQQVNQFDVRGPTGTTSPRALAYFNGSLWLGAPDTQALHKFSTDGSLENTTGPNRGYKGLATNETTLFGPDENGNLTAIRRLGDSQTPEEPIDQLTIQNVRGPSTVSVGEEFSVSTTVANPGSNRTNESVAFRVDTDSDGNLEQVGSRDVSLAAGANTTVGFVADLSLQSGTYTYAIQTGSTSSDRQLEAVGATFETGVSTGDPHLVTFDDVAYDFMAAGEYTLVREPEGSLEIQARQVPVSGSNSVTINTAVATTLDGHTVVIDARDSTPVQVDGTPTELGESETISVGNGSVRRSGSTYAVVYPGDDNAVGPSDERLTADMFGNRLDIRVRLDPDRSEPVTGLLGNLDGNSSNDVALANGTALSTSPSADVLYGTYRDDWRVTDDTTLFTYEGDNGPGTYYDPLVPQNVVTVDDLDQETLTEAQTLAEEAGLEPGTVAYESAIIDYALTGDESYFSSAQQQDSSGDVEETVDPEPPEQPPELNGTNSLRVTATNASGVTVPNAEIILYNASYAGLDSKQADASGEVQWSTLTTGEYTLELYGPDGAFWGSSSVTVDADGTITNVQRTAPRLSSVELEGDENGEGGYYGGRSVTISPEIRNDGPQRPVRVRIKVDTNEDDSVEQNITPGDQEEIISSGGVRKYNYEFDPSTNGTKQIQVVTETYLNNNWTETDYSGWTKNIEIEHNIIGYDPQFRNYTNFTTSSDSAAHLLSSSSLPSDTSASQTDLPGFSYRKQNTGGSNKYPWSAVGALTIVGDTYCSATVIDKYHIITAGHCIYNSSGNDWKYSPLSIKFEAARNGSQGTALTESEFEHIYVYKKWAKERRITHDIAVITLENPIGTETGTFGYQDHPVSSPQYTKYSHLTGYPANYAPYTSPGEQWDLRADGQGTPLGNCIDRSKCHQVATGGPLNELMYPGFSGGPVWQINSANNPQIISIMSKAVTIPDGLRSIRSIARPIVDTILDGTSVRISRKKHSDITQMIQQGYQEASGSLPQSTEGRSGVATGDPHLTTYDGVAYDFQAAGEFVLTNDTDGSPHVQARLRPVAGRDVSVISAVATEINGTEITIDARDQQTLTVDGTARSLETGDSLTVEDGEIFRTPDRYVVVYPGEDNKVDDGDSRLEVTVVDNRLDVVVKPNRTAVDSMRGLLGSPDGNTSNDIALADGTALSTSPSFEALYGQYREDYRVTAENSLFDYDDGESAAAFYDADYPSERVTVNDLPDDDRREAIDAALNAGLEPGTASFRDAVIDYALTGDRSYIESASRAARQTEVTVDATPSETPLTAPELTVGAEQLATEEQPLTVSVTASHPDPNNATVVISNGTDVVFEQDVTGAFESERTVSWDTTVDGEPVDDGVYTLGVVATSESGVRNVTTRGVLVDNTAPSVTLETTETDLNASVDNATFTFSYNDTISGVDPESVTVLEDGTDVTGSAQINASSASYELTGLEPGENRTVEVRVADEAGQTANRTVTISVATAGGDDGADGGTGGGGGGGGGGGAATDDFPLIDVDPVVVEETNIGEQTGEFEDTETVSRVTFDENTLGSVTVSEFDGLSDSTVQTITERIAGDVTDIDSASEIDLVTVVDISPGSLASDQTSATVEMEVPTEQLDDPENAVIVHRTATGWTIQETTVQDVSGGTVTLTAPVDSFSLFAVVERSPSQVTTPTSTPAQVTADGTPKPESEPTPADETQTPEPPEAVESPQPTSTATEPGGFSVPLLVIVLVLLGGIIAAVAILRRRDML